ncbi:MAG TPA: sugar phosphate isomerase/epimerase family protein [Devosia sp.]|jgi:sugar phosphate isomerase/epimerase|uniref:sugar phosphate isomerase/epimerase family protein n=1 Tax=Devosia sp. TaxID=1871048 RepID=UPI002DDD8C1F|nr:sugar phosphate isomerase/epimerase family protein [Devosia sp.]HEV2516448.1 sugar phosphate isomerase/epimerase family protein [Devosia sp.]
MFSLMRGSIPDAGNDPLDAISKAAALGADEITFYSLFELSPTLDPAVLRELKAEADNLGIAIAASLDWLNPLRLDRHTRELQLGDGNLALGVRRLLETGVSLGMREMFFTIGTLEDRAGDWRAQLGAVATLLIELKPVLADLGMRALVKTHEEITSHECLELIERVGPDTLGVSYDPANMLVRLEEPLAAARRLAPHVTQVHIDDATLRFEGDTDLRRHLAPVGQGAVNWPSLLALLPTAKRLIELHRGQFAIPAFDQPWLAGQPYIELGEYAALVRSAVRRGSQLPIDQDDITLRLPAALEMARS